MLPSHRGSDRLPFSGPLDPRFFHCGPSHEEALARLHFLVDQGCRLGLVLGRSGTGKSWLLEVFARALAASGAQVVCTSLTGIDGHELLWRVAAQLGAGPLPGEHLFRLWRRVDACLAESALFARTTAVLLDNADEAAGDVLPHVIRLAECDRSGEARVTLVLSANVDRLRRLGPRLVELASLRVDLHPWQESETVAHVESVLAGTLGPVSRFTAGAMARLHELAGGVPRRINQLADLALVAGAGGGLSQIDEATVDGVYHELNAHLHPAPAPA